MLLIEIKNLQMERYTISRKRRFNVANMSYLHKLIHRYRAAAIIIPAESFVKINEIILNLTWNCEGPISELSWEKRDEVEWATSLNLASYHKKLQWRRQYGSGVRIHEQMTDVKKTLHTKDSRLRSPVIFIKGPNTVSGRKASLKQRYWKTRYPDGENFWPFSITTYT